MCIFILLHTLHVDIPSMLDCKIIFSYRTQLKYLSFLKLGLLIDCSLIIGILILSKHFSLP
jgi:hypothetical protein